jgi:hypothetical protein
MYVTAIILSFLTLKRKFNATAHAVCPIQDYTGLSCTLAQINVGVNSNFQLHSQDP